MLIEALSDKSSYRSDICEFSWLLYRNILSYCYGISDLFKSSVRHRDVPPKSVT